MKLFSPRLSTTRLRAAGPKISRGYLRSAQKAEKPAKARSSIRRGPGRHWENKPAVIVYPDGRERCNPGTPEGKAEYLWRKIQMWVRQVHPEINYPVCCHCMRRLPFAQGTFEHEFGRHASRIDERIVNPETGKPQNGLSCWECNSKRGSKRTPIRWYGYNVVKELREDIA